MSDWRSTTERDRLVEQLVTSERRARVAEAKVRALAASDDQVTVLAARVVELEEIISKQNQRIQRRTA